MKTRYLMAAMIWMAAGASSLRAQILAAPRIPPAQLVAGETYSASHRPVIFLEEDARNYRNWKYSLVPVIASQAMDVASSYGMRELNPFLGSADGRFGAKAAGIKFGITAAALGTEYWIVRKHPRAARPLTKLNWSAAIVTAGFAAHNFAIR